MTTNNHQANGPVSIERLHQMREILSKAAAQRDGGDIGYAMSDAVRLIDEVLESEPVAYITYKGYLLHASDPKLAEFSDPTPLYADPQPSPVVPEVLPCPVLLEPGMRFGKGVRTQTMLDALERRAKYYAELEAMTPEQRAEHDAGMREFAVMLQGKAEPVSQHTELSVWYGSMPETNGKANWTAILHRKGECLSTGITIERSEYPERVRYEADRVRHIIGELKEEPDILAYDADAHSGYVKPSNSPLIEDDVRRMDWLASKTVDVREPMVYGSHSLFWSQTITDEEDDYHATKLREQIDAAMAAEHAAAPQQDALSESEPRTRVEAAGLTIKGINDES